MEYSINQFWKPRLASVCPVASIDSLRGWHSVPDKLSSYVEAELSLRPDFNDLSQSVWLIAAPGAVGKSTLAKKICEAKVEHFRMTKGALGVALRERLVADNVLSLEAEMYFLEPNVLGEQIGVSFHDLKLKRYSMKSRAYLQSILDELE